MGFCEQIDCKLNPVKEQIANIEKCLDGSQLSIYKIEDATPGVINREWHNSKPADTVSNSTTAVGRAFRLGHDFSLPTTTNTIVQSLALNDTNNTANELDIQVLDTYITVPVGGVWIRYTGGSEGYRAIEVGECCGPLVLKDELGYQDRIDNDATVGPVFLPEGQHAFRAWNIDSGGTNSSHIVRYSTDGVNFVAALPNGVKLSTKKRGVQCATIKVCDNIPEGWSTCYPAICTPSISDPTPTQQVIVSPEICTGPFVAQTTRTGWLQTWTAPTTTNVATVTGDWLQIGANVISPTCPTDVHASIDFGVLYYQLRRMRMYQWVDWRLIINGVAVYTETYDEYNYKSERTDTNPDVINPLDVRSHTMGHSNAVRLNIPGGATVGVEVRYRYNFNAAQASAYGRLIQGLRSQATFVFVPRVLVTNITTS